jgi:hypothetical protein
VSEAWGQLGTPEEGEHTPLEAVIRMMVKTVTEDTSVCVWGGIFFFCEE